MNCNDIIQQGEEAKYQITITRQGFDMNTDDFQLLLSWGMLGKSLTITKDECFSNEDDEWFFIFSTVNMIGKVTVDCEFKVPDTDYADGYRTESDRQILCFVAPTPLPQLLCTPVAQCTDTTVVYQRTEDSSVYFPYSDLLDSQGNAIMTSDNMQVQVLKK